MGNTLLIDIAVIIFYAGVIYSIVGYFLRKKRIGRKMHPLWVLVCCTVFSLFLVYLHGNLKANGGPVDTFFVAILGCVRTLAGENGVWDTREQIIDDPSQLGYWYSVYTAMLHIFLSGVLFGAAMKLVNHFFPIIGYKFLISNHIFVFSGISEREVLFAEDVRRKEEEIRQGSKIGRTAPALVFLHSGEEVPGLSSLMERIHDISGYVFSYDLENMPLPFYHRKTRIDYFLLQQADGQNVNDAMKLAGKYKIKTSGEKTCSEVYVHVLSDYPETENLLDSVSAESNCSFRLISENRTMIYQLIDRVPLFSGASVNEKGEKELNILIVGAGRIGREAVKVCSWCGYTLDLKPNIWVIDNTELPLHILEKECPETLAQGNIHFDVVDVRTAEFTKYIREHKNIGYVICALGDEHLNLRTSIDIRSIFYEEPPYSIEKKRLPIINVLINDGDLQQMSQQLKFKGNKNNGYGYIGYDIKSFGSLQEYYTWENIGASYLDVGGFEVHRAYERIFGAENSREESIRTYDLSEYGRRSSIASALHGKYKLYALLCERMGSKEEFDWSQKPTESMYLQAYDYLYDIRISVKDRMERVEELAKVEHLRWNAYTRAIGWCKAKKAVWEKEWEPILAKKNMAAKCHPDLVEWVELDEPTKDNDRSPVWNLPFMISAAVNSDFSFFVKRAAGEVDFGSAWYKDMDVQAMLYWSHQNVKLNGKIHISGSKEKVAAYLRQALLMNVYGDKKEYHIWCKEDIKEEFKNIAEHITDVLVYHKEILTEEAMKEKKKKKEQVLDVDAVKEKKGYLTEQKQRLLESAQEIHRAYAATNGKVGWDALDEHKKDSNLSAAALAEMHLKAFQAGVSVEEMARAEHERWIRFHYLKGWSYAKKRDNAQKKHHLLLPYEKLDRKEQKKAIEVVRAGLSRLIK